MDVGANIGCTTIIFGQLAKKVLAFEPTPATFRNLEKNIKNSGLQNIELYKFTLGDKNSKATVSFSDSNRSGAFIADKVDASDYQQSADIEIKKLDEFSSAINLEKIDLLKLDVEGFEQRVIEGGGGVISKHRPLIQLELNSWCLNALHRTSLPDFLDFIVERFPVALAIQNKTFLDIHDKKSRWKLMEKNILEDRFKEMIIGFDKNRLEDFYKIYQNI